MIWFFWRNNQQLLLKFVPYELLLATIAMHSMEVLRELQLIHPFRACQKLRGDHCMSNQNLQFSQLATFFFIKPFFVRGSNMISLKVCIL